MWEVVLMGWMGITNTLVGVRKESEAIWYLLGFQCFASSKDSFLQATYTVWHTLCVLFKSTCQLIIKPPMNWMRRVCPGLQLNCVMLWVLEKQGWEPLLSIIWLSVKINIFTRPVFLWLSSSRNIFLSWRRFLYFFSPDIMFDSMRVTVLTRTRTLQRHVKPSPGCPKAIRSWRRQWMELLHNL